MLEAGTMKPYRVWIMTPESSTVNGVIVRKFPWNWGNLIEHKRLILTGYDDCPGAMGSAQFNLLRWTYSDNDPTVAQPFIWDNDNLPLTLGEYVVVTVGELADAAPNGRVALSAVRWFGFLENYRASQLAGTAELIGTVTALGIGHMADRMQNRGWSRANVAVRPLLMSNPETANQGGQVDGQVVGNAVLGDDGSNNHAPVYLFQNDPSLCGTTDAQMWTRWRLLRHLQLVCLTVNQVFTGVVWTVTCDDASQAPDPPVTSFGLPTIAGYLNDPSAPEVYQLRNQTFKGAIDLLVPRPHGFGWTLRLVAGADGAVGWDIYVYTYSDSTTYGLPAFTGAAVDLTTVPVLDFRRTRQSLDLPDEVIVECQQIVFGSTVALADGNMGAGWDTGAGSTTQQNVFRKGCLGDAVYTALPTAGTQPERREKNRTFRQSPALFDVFTRFVIKGAPGSGLNTDLLRVKDQPGFGNPQNFLCPPVTWDGTTLLVDDASQVSRCPFLPTATLSRTLPWIEGATNTGLDLRPAITRIFPSFAKPMLFYYNKSAPAGSQWINLLSRGADDRPVPALDIDDRGMALRIAFDSSERLGFGIISYDPTVDGIYDTSPDVGPNANVEGKTAFDYTKLVATIGVPSDQRVSVTIRRPGITSDSDVRNSLKITDERHQCLIMLGGSIVGIGTNGQPLRVAGAGAGANHVVVRNDFPAVQKQANRLAAFAFRLRQGFACVMQRPDALPSWARIGGAIGTVQEAAAAGNVPAVIATYNTVIERIEVRLEGQPRATIVADIPITPKLMTPSSNPSSGGPVAVTLGGTIPQSVQQSRQDVRDLQASGQRVPLIPAYTPGGSTVVQSVYRVYGGNTLGVVSAVTYTGIKPLGTSIASVPVAVPINGATYADGLGYGRLVLNGVETGPFVWIASKATPASGGTPVQEYLDFMITGGDIVSNTSVSVTCLAGGTASVVIPQQV